MPTRPAGPMLTGELLYFFWLRTCERYLLFTAACSATMKLKSWLSGELASHHDAR